MSLQTDLIFIAALQQSEDVAAVLGDRIYPTAIPRPDAEVQNEPVPYVIVTFEGIQPDEQTKDDDFDQEDETVQIGVTIVAETREKLANVSELVRRTIKEYFEKLKGTDPADLDEYDQEMLPLLPYSAKPSGGQITYDPDKPCSWMTLTYTCDVASFTNDENI